MAKTNYEFVKAWRKRNKDKVNAQARRYRAKHPEQRSEVVKRYKDNGGRAVEAKAARKRRRAKPGYGKARWLREKEKQVSIAGRPRPSVCDVCKGKNGRWIVFDHCHTYGHFRGWLCERCNRALGVVKDDPKLLRALARYLERTDGQTHIKGEECPSLFNICWSGSELSN